MSKMSFNIPNILTLLRVLMIPVFVLVFYLSDVWGGVISAAVFALAAITDWLDGYLARKLNQSTPFGAFLDPVADKLMVAVALVLLVQVHNSIWFTLPAIVIISREIVISALREWMAELGKRTSVAVSYIGKLKTTAQMIALIALLLTAKQLDGVIYQIGMVLIYIAAILTLWSMFIYLKAAWPDLAKDNPILHKDEG